MLIPGGRRRRGLQGTGSRREPPAVPSPEPSASSTPSVQLYPPSISSLLKNFFYRVSGLIDAVQCILHFALWNLWLINWTLEIFRTHVSFLWPLQPSVTNSVALTQHKYNHLMVLRARSLKSVGWASQVHVVSAGATFLLGVTYKCWQVVWPPLFIAWHRHINTNPEGTISLSIFGITVFVSGSSFPAFSDFPDFLVSVYCFLFNKKDGY